MTFVMPTATGFLALIVIAFVAGFFWTLGSRVATWVANKTGP